MRENKLGKNVYSSVKSSVWSSVSSSVWSSVLQEAKAVIK